MTVGIHILSAQMMTHNDFVDPLVDIYGFVSTTIGWIAMKFGKKFMFHTG